MKKGKKSKPFVPAGTQQETGVTRFIKKTKLKEIVKDARVNNKKDVFNKGKT